MTAPSIAWPGQRETRSGAASTRSLGVTVTHDHLERTTDWAENNLTQADVEEIRQRWEALRPDFVHIGRADWLDYALRVVDAIEPCHRYP